MAAEDLGNASLESLPAAAPPETLQPLLAPYAPYDATTRWPAGAALGVAVLICVATVAIALAGALLIFDRTRSARGIDGSTLVPLFLAQVTMTVGALLAARWRGDQLVGSLALKAPIGGLASYASWLALQLVAVGAFTLIGGYVFDHDQTSDLKGMAEILRSGWWPLALVIIGVGAPLSEELLFRGFLQTALVTTRLGFWGASVVTTTLWTAMHAGYSLVGLTEVFLIGLIFCLMLRRTGSLRITIAVHAIYNTLIALVVIFAPKDWLGF